MANPTNKAWLTLCKFICGLCYLISTPPMHPPKKVVAVISICFLLDVLCSNPEGTGLSGPFLLDPPISLGPTNFKQFQMRRTLGKYIFTFHISIIQLLFLDSWFDCGQCRTTWNGKSNLGISHHDTSSAPKMIMTQVEHKKSS